MWNEIAIPLAVMAGVVVGAVLTLFGLWVRSEDGWPVHGVFMMKPGEKAGWEHEFRWYPPATSEPPKPPPAPPSPANMPAEVQSFREASPNVRVDTVTQREIDEYMRCGTVNGETDSEMWIRLAGEVGAEIGRKHREAVEAAIEAEMAKPYWSEHETPYLHWRLQSKTGAAWIVSDVSGGWRVALSHEDDWRKLEFRDAGAAKAWCERAERHGDEL